jgi:hypothetical protein
MLTATHHEGFINQRIFQRAKANFDAEYANRLEGFTSPESIDMMRTGSSEGGRKVEWIIYEWLIDAGFEAAIGNSRETGDIYVQIKMDDEIISVECKGSRPKTKGKDYAFQGIQPHKSDVTVIVFIRPDGIQARVGNTSRLCDWASKHYTYIETGKKPGYSISYSKHGKNRNEHGIEIFRNLTKENFLWAINGCE